MFFDIVFHQTLVKIYISQ